jgi:hypothetical protein
MKVSAKSESRVDVLRIAVRVMLTIILVTLIMVALDNT